MFHAHGLLSTLTYKLAMEIRGMLWIQSRNLHSPWTGREISTPLFLGWTDGRICKSSTKCRETPITEYSKSNQQNSHAKGDANRRQKLDPPLPTGRPKLQRPLLTLLFFRGDKMTEPKVRLDPHNIGITGEYEADGTLYTAWVLHVTDFSLQTLGSITDGYLVICGLTGKAYLLQRRGYLDIGYLMEKFNLRTETDAKNFRTLLTAMTLRA